MFVPKGLQQMFCMKDRVLGYQEALAEHDIQFIDENICVLPSQKESVDAFLHNLHGLEKVDAIYCATEILAVLCIEPLKKLGYRIPEDISLIGFGDSPMCKHTDPPLSTVSGNPREQVHQAIDLLLKILDGDAPYEPGFHEVSAKIILRKSTKTA